MFEPNSFKILALVWISATSIATDHNTIPNYNAIRSPFIRVDHHFAYCSQENLVRVIYPWFAKSESNSCKSYFARSMHYLLFDRLSSRQRRSSRTPIFGGNQADQQHKKKQNFQLENSRIKSVTRKLAKVESPSISIELMVEDLTLEVILQQLFDWSLGSNTHRAQVVEVASMAVDAQRILARLLDLLSRGPFSSPYHRALQVCFLRAASCVVCNCLPNSAELSQQEILLGLAP